MTVQGTEIKQTNSINGIRYGCRAFCSFKWMYWRACWR